MAQLCKTFTTTEKEKEKEKEKERKGNHEGERRNG
jgi:hypothetical protein